MTLRTVRHFAATTGLLPLLFGCTRDSDYIDYDASAPEGSVFESDSPLDSSRSGGSELSGDGTANASDDSSESGTDATRAIEEADIIKLQGDRLYALSQYGGLNIIDISDASSLKLLGRKKVQATPFEMYVRDSVVLALYDGYGEYVEGESAGYWNWIQTGYAMAFDTSNPSNPALVGKFPIAGSIVDSRIVGDVLYVVGFENNCWGCETGQHTTILSLDISSPSNIEQVDQLSFADDTSGYSWTRSIFVNDQRMYVAGPDWGVSGPVGSQIQVVDVSDPTGKLVQGATVQVAGTVNSRWQMDEFDGYLRVITQPNAWDMTVPVTVQTFKVDGPNAISSVANVTLSGVPAGETLRSVRFDEERAYAITAMQTDPLFTVDLSDPTAPEQGGSLAMPGWIYYMEPRGDRLVALGFDEGNTAGGMTVSLFNVSDLNQPSLIERVNFGGDWSYTTEGQDQIHKAFQVLDESNLILMPFSGWDYSEDACAGKSTNGIQLIDWSGDDLTLQGVASLVGQPRRGFLHDDRLFAVSEERLETYDIADRANPSRVDSLRMAENVTSTVVAGDTLVKITNDWYSNTVGIDTTTLEDVGGVATLGHLDLPIPSNNCIYSYLASVTATDNRVYVVFNQYDYTGSTSGTNTRLLTVDVSSRAAPQILGDVTLDFGEGWGYWYAGGLVSAGKSAVAVGDAFVILSTTSALALDGSYLGMKSVAEVLDMTDPTNPSVTSLEIPGYTGTTGLFASGSTVALGYYLDSPKTSGRVRFYATRIDVSDPSNPEMLSPINVPGSVLGFDAGSSNLMTADYEEVAIANVTYSDCYSKYGSWNFSLYDSSELGTCYAMRNTLNLIKLGDRYATRLGSKALEVGQQIGQVAQGQDRLFITGGNGYGYGYALVDVAYGVGGYYYGFTEGTLPLFVAQGLASGEFALGSMTLVSGNSWSGGSGPIAASGDRAVLSTGWQGKLVVVDGQVATEPVVVRESDIAGYVSNLTTYDGVAIASMGYDGVATISFE